MIETLWGYDIIWVIANFGYGGWILYIGYIVYCTSGGWYHFFYQLTAPGAARPDPAPVLLEQFLVFPLNPWCEYL